MELVMFTKKVYEYFAYRLYGKDMNWRLVNGKKSAQTVEQFTAYMLNKYGAAAGPGFIWFYVIFQFGRFQLTGFRPESHTNFILPTMIFGKSAIEKFEERPAKYDALVWKSAWMMKHDLSQQEFVQKHGYTFTTSMKKVNRKKVERILMNYRDPIKMVVSMSNQGMDLCEDLTDLYNSKDSSCQACPYATECKALLREKNPSLYELRGYER